MALVKEIVKEPRYYVRGDFNPSSPDQLIAYMNHFGFEGGKNHKSKTGKPSTDEDTLRRLSRRDPFFKQVLAWRKINKMDSTYAQGLLARAQADGRIHPEFPHIPSTWRLSSRNPNFQNLPSAEDTDLDLHEAVMASEIRRGIVAGPDCVLVSADFSAIEAVITGWYSDDIDYMRVARMGIHSYVLSHKIGEPADLSWSDQDLAEYLKAIKTRYHNTALYKGTKKIIHGTNYGETPWGLKMQHPDLFPTLAVAQELQDFYFQLCPKEKAWQNQCRLRADKQGYLGGTDHPFRFKHWFWDVTTWDPVKKCPGPGSDWNRCVAFYPQSTAAGIIFEACLLLMDPSSPWYVGDLYFGQTPLRALVHDEILAEVPKIHLPRFIERLRMAMKEPLSELNIGVDINVGPNWAEMEPYR